MKFFFLSYPWRTGLCINGIEHYCQTGQKVNRHEITTWKNYAFAQKNGGTNLGRWNFFVNKDFAPRFDNLMISITSSDEFCYKAFYITRNQALWAWILEFEMSVHRKPAIVQQTEPPTDGRTDGNRTDIETQIVV